MKTPIGAVITAAAALGALALVGCGGSAVSMNRPAGAVLQAANQQALAGSFQVSFTGQLQVDLSGVTPPAGVSAAELQLLQSAINSTELTGVAQIESQNALSLSFSLSPIVTQTWHVLYLDGTEYISDNGTQWHRETASQADQAATGGLSKFKSDFKTWGEDLRNQATVTKLGTTTIGGQQVEHIQTTISGANLNQALTTILGQVAGTLGAQGSSLSADLPALEGLLHFTQVKADSYVLTSNGYPARTDLSAGITLNLSELSSLLPGVADLPTGSAPMTFTLNSNFSDYGKDFNLTKPTDIVTGPLPTPSGLAGALSQT